MISQVSELKPYSLTDKPLPVILRKPLNDEHACLGLFSLKKEMTRRKLFNLIKNLGVLDNKY